VSYTTFRQHVANEIAGALGITSVVDGAVAGPIERSDMVCSWPLGVRESDDSVDVEEIEIAVRILRAWQQQLDPGAPIDPSPLEETMETLKSTSHNIQTTSGPWFWRPVEVEADLAEWHITARVVGWQYNLFEQV